MTSDLKYGSLGPVALCGFLQEKYGNLITEKAWPALSATLPVSNHTPIPDAMPKVKTRHCYYCKSPDHVKNECPKLSAKRKKEAEEASNEGSPAVVPTTSPSPVVSSMAAWS
jgi:Zinc knuckle.